MMNSRQMGVVQGLIWLVAALATIVLALGVFLLMAAVGVAMLLVGTASQAARSIFGGSPRHRVVYRSRSPEQGARTTVLEGKVLRRPD